MDRQKHVCQLEEPEGWFSVYRKKHGALLAFLVSMIVLHNDPTSVHVCFKSHAALKREKLRHLDEIHKHVIHPLSKLRLVVRSINLYI